MKVENVWHWLEVIPRFLGEFLAVGPVYSVVIVPRSRRFF